MFYRYIKVLNNDVKKKTDLKYINFNLDELFPRQCDYYDAHDECLGKTKKSKNGSTIKLKDIPKTEKIRRISQSTNSVRTKISINRF